MKKQLLAILCLATAAFACGACGETGGDKDIAPSENEQTEEDGTDDSGNATIVPPIENGGEFDSNE